MKPQAIQLYTNVKLQKKKKKKKIMNNVYRGQKSNTQYIYIYIYGDYLILLVH